MTRTTTGTVDIRPCTSSPDLDQARALMREYAPDIGEAREYQQFDQEVQQLPGKYTPPLGRLLLAWSNGAALGCIALRELSPGTCEMKRMYVRPTARGAGVGRALAARLIEEARSIGYRSMKLDTSAEMLAARRLYQSLGFRPCERYNDDPVPCTLFFELSLDQ